MKPFALLAFLSAPAALAAPAAFHPVLVQLPGEARPELLGAWTAGSWLDAPRTAPRLQGGEVYRPLLPSGPGAAVKGGRAASFGEPCEQAFEVALTPAASRNTFRLFTDGKLNARPRPVRSLPNSNAVYREIVRAELVKRGLKNPHVNLLGLTRVDLDGNGSEEVIVEAAHFAERSGLYPPSVGQPGDYSLLLLREVVKGQVVTTVLGEHVAPQKPWTPGDAEPMPMALLYRLAGVADLNGDGRMELVTFGAYYEGYGLGVLEWTPGGWKTRLEGGCGV
ncbi:hypothetical protein DEIPH_ctg044orf0033 [Deinococcus phoenicis]|uniref:VCBS repeat-containing protein n=1 Tax=Deinococcus phoenicis TaxID=1476583 RepID=A0A016QN44_9DEIO|nr:hypothetical protein [Deinococcus phoenicis]EYB67317.1 hypothetical protein DEIPH_ctg044orf0033 [Deinococcus phoenicis]